MSVGVNKVYYLIGLPLRYIHTRLVEFTWDTFSSFSFVSHHMFVTNFIILRCHIFSSCLYKQGLSYALFIIWFIWSLYHYYTHNQAIHFFILFCDRLFFVLQVIVGDWVFVWHLHGIKASNLQDPYQI